MKLYYKHSVHYYQHDVCEHFIQDGVYIGTQINIRNEIILFIPGLGTPFFLVEIFLIRTQIFSPNCRKKFGLKKTTTRFRKTYINNIEIIMIND
jgi:hypothetical protein